MPINSFLYPGAKFIPPYEIDNSVRFNDGDSPRLVISNPTAGTRTKGTFSTWFKRCTFGANQYLFSTWNNSASGYSSGIILLQSDDRLSISNYVASGASGGSTLITERKFRDPSAWYHVVIAWDTTDGTAADRYKIYVNGTRETVFNGTPAYPTSNQDLFFQAGGTSNPYHIGFESVGSDQKYFDGYLAETVLIDGSALAASSFGEFDEDSPTIWKPKDVSGLTFGNEGFYLDYEDSGDLGDDESGNGNDFAETNLAATDQATDTPTNNFCTLNPLYNAYVDPTFSEGNLKITQSSAWAGAKATMGVSKGKWYWEVKISTALADHHHGVQQENVDETAQNPQNTTGTTVFFNSDGGEMKSDSTATTADYGTLDNGDILGIALDMDAGSYGQITIFDNGSAIVSDFNLVSSSTTVMPFASIGNSTAEYNFGNPTFSISSSNSDANGYGSFEHSVPSGHYSLCTKNLAEYG